MTNVKSTPPEIAGMVTVSKSALFATVGQLDVLPSIVGTWDRVYGYKQHWELRNRKLLGVTNGGTTFSECRYMVTRDFFEANQATFERLDTNTRNVVGAQ